MSNKDRPYRLIISGGGTGGHIYPALAIADRFRELHPGTDVLFVGATGKMEMQKVPESGYPIKGIWISGLQRKNMIRNILFPIKLLVSVVQSYIILRKFDPDIAIGVGGFASGPMLWIASLKKIPTLIQEQNSLAGITNRLLAKKADRICVAYEGMQKYFPKEKIILTGNPVRKDILNFNANKKEAYQFFGLEPGKKTVFVMGGSLGARTINKGVLYKLDRIIEEDLQLIWQIGRFYYDDYQEKLKNHNLENIRTFEFLNEISKAYAVADLIISRAGALSVSELCVAGKPVLFVPSPNVAEDHQTKNAKALVKKNAAVMVTDREAVGTMIDKAVSLLKDDRRCTELSTNIKKMALTDATENIIKEIEKLLN